MVQYKNENENSTHLIVADSVSHNLFPPSVLQRLANKLFNKQELSVTRTEKAAQREEALEQKKVNRAKLVEKRHNDDESKNAFYANFARARVRAARGFVFSHSFKTDGNHRATTRSINVFIHVINFGRFAAPPSDSLRVWYARIVRLTRPGFTAELNFLL